jgi:hypothetical protein
MNNYNPSNWYWAVGGSTSQVWSSAAAAYVPTTDATYQTWLGAGNRATQIDSEASLAAVLQTAYLAGLGALQADVPVVLTFLQFMALFTSAAQTAIVGSTDPQLKLFLLMASGAGAISLSNTEVATGVNYLESIGLIAPDRPAQVLANQSPA